MVEVPDISLTSRVATMASMASIAMSYQPGLLPRSVGDQAILTGLTSAVNYGMVATIGSAVEGVATAAVGHERMQRPGAAAATHAIAHAGAVAAGIGVWRLLPRRESEPVKRATLRSAAFLTGFTGVTGMIAAGVLGAAEVMEARTGRSYRRMVGPGSLALATVATVALMARNRRDTKRDLLPPPVDPLPLSSQATAYEQRQVAKYEQVPSLSRSLLFGAGVSAGLQGAAFAESLAAEGIAHGIRRGAPALAPFANWIGHTATLSVVGGTVLAGLEYVNRKADAGGAAIEAAYDKQPTMLTVSGGPGSQIPFDTLSREGRRVVNMALPAEAIEEVMGTPAVDPIRAFAGIATANLVDERVDLLMRELEDMGAFERKVLCFCSPTGTGYLNYVMMETLEYLTGGDCATFALQYSLRPSFISLDRVAMGREQNRAMLHALTWRLRAIPEDKRPRLVLFGESLGAHTMQDAFLHEGTSGFARAGVDRALFIGTPAGSGWAKRWRADPQRLDPEGRIVEIADYAQFQQLPAQRRDPARIFLVSHHEDPIVKFDPQLAVEMPRWLKEPREPGVPRGMRWRPVGTFLNVGVDLKNSTDVVPGVFVARGHDYRAGLARFTSLAFDLPVDEP
ncbi:MAG TPA: alpha/beta-hydrolase family protein, partial [Actinomycetota bacterium]|nr:alpha/beta-hydrolase family protein [Actinomycetota bacterium]